MFRAVNGPNAEMPEWALDALLQRATSSPLLRVMQSNVVPHLLGSGSRLFDNTGGFQTNYECVRIIHTPAATHYKYRRRS